MKKPVVLILLLLLAGTSLGQQVRVIAPTGLWVTDQGDFLTPSEEGILTRKLKSYADTTSTQIIVVTVKELGGYDASEYAFALGRRWKVGQEGKDNGIVVLLSRKEHAVFIAPGYGMEGPITDALAGRIVRNVMIPQFRDGRFFQGLTDGVNTIMLAASGEFKADQVVPNDRARGPIPFTLILGAFYLIIMILSASRRNRGGGGRGSRFSSGLLSVILWSALGSGRHGGGGFGGGGFGGGGFGGGGGSFGGGGAGGSW